MHTIKEVDMLSAKIDLLINRAIEKQDVMQIFDSHDL
jgi:hypothetical protein